jgi:hypothetical protein
VPAFSAPACGLTLVAWRMADLTPPELWWRYIGLGGNAPPTLSPTTWPAPQIGRPSSTTSSPRRSTSICGTWAVRPSSPTALPRATCTEPTWRQAGRSRQRAVGGGAMTTCPFSRAVTRRVGSVQPSAPRAAPRALPRLPLFCASMRGACTCRAAPSGADRGLPSARCTTGARTSAATPAVAGVRPGPRGERVGARVGRANGGDAGGGAVSGVRSSRHGRTCACRSGGGSRPGGRISLRGWLPIDPGRGRWSMWPAVRGARRSPGYLEGLGDPPVWCGQGGS